MNYLYNGVELPALPEWDREAYPYALIEYYGENSGDGATAKLYVFDIQAGKQTVQISSSYTLTCIAASDVASFKRMEAQLMSGGEAVSSPVFGSVINSNRTTISVSDVLWANYDVPNYTDGGMLLAASEPIPVQTAYIYDKASFLAGLAFGLCGRGVGVMPEPIAYLYNGVQLPALPEYDKTAYPYARICFSDGYYSFDVMSAEPVASIQNISKYELNGMAESGEWGSFVFYGFGNSLNENEEDVFGFGSYVNNTYSQKRTDTIIWANYDVVKTDGTLYLAASEPVPVYE